MSTRKPPMGKKKGPGDRTPAKSSIGKDADPVKVFAERLRDHKELESRWAVLHETRVEYFRGRDFAAILRTHPDLKTVLRDDLDLLPAAAAAADEDDAEAIAGLLLRRKLVFRCDRVVNTVRPGKKKLSKWPARLVLCPMQNFSEDDAFFAWAFERRRPLWQKILSFLLPVVTLACCLFPIFPHWCKLGVLYFCLAFLTLIFGVLFLRGAIFGSVWLLLGWRVWFFPNLLAEHATLTELFQFWPDKKSEDDQPPPKRTTRLAFALLSAASIWVLLHHAPDEAARSRYRKQVSNIIDEVVIWKPNLAALSGKSVNETLQNVTPETLQNATADGTSQNVTTDEELQNVTTDEISQSVTTEISEDVKTEVEVEGSTEV